MEGEGMGANGIGGDDMGADGMGVNDMGGEGMGKDGMGGDGKISGPIIGCFVADVEALSRCRLTRNKTIFERIALRQRTKLMRKVYNNRFLLSAFSLSYAVFVFVCLVWLNC